MHQYVPIIQNHPLAGRVSGYPKGFPPCLLSDPPLHFTRNRLEMGFALTGYNKKIVAGPSYPLQIEQNRIDRFLVVGQGSAATSQLLTLKSHRYHPLCRMVFSTSGKTMP
jgi:hypothetical protein